MQKKFGEESKKVLTMQIKLQALLSYTYLYFIKLMYVYINSVYQILNKYDLDNKEYYQISIQEVKSAILNTIFLYQLT